MDLTSTPLDEAVKNWSSNGKEECILLFERAYRRDIPGGLVAITGGHEFQRLIYDLVKMVVLDSVEVDDAVLVFNELLTALDIKSVFPSLLVDILAIADAEISVAEDKDQQTKLRSLTAACMKLVSEPLLKERLEMETLENMGLIPSKNAFNQKYVKTKTKLFYKQHKFNLFREENEGYSKLVSELGHEKRSPQASVAMLDNIKSLIGRFNLDPNRVLDVILEAFESHTDEKEFFISLLESYPCETSTFVNILGFKFHSYQDDDRSKTTPTPLTVYRLCAILLHEGLVRLTDLYPHLSPKDSQLKDFHETTMKNAQAKARKAQVVSLVEKSDEEKTKESDLEKERELSKDHMLSLEANQKLGLCHALLELKDWDGAYNLIKLLPPFLPAWCPAIVKSLSNLINLSIEPLYRSYASRAAKGPPKSSSLNLSKSTIKPCSSLVDLYPAVFEMLYCLGPYVHTDPILVAKIVRLGRAFMKDKTSSRNSEEHSQEKEKVFHGFVSVLDEVVLPSISLLPCNCGMAEELWAMIKLLPYERRYQLYGHWKNGSYDTHPLLIDVKSETLSRGRYIMKRITKDNVKPSGRQIGKLSHSNPGIIFDYVLSQIQRYDNFIIPVVDSLKYLTPLAYDVLAYCIIEALGNPQRERLKHGDTNISNWLKGLASFCGNIFRKYPIELNGLLQYVSNQLKAGKSFDLLVLKEVIQKMSGIDISDEVTAAQLEALAGGELLQAEGAYFNQVRNTKKSSQRLREALVDANLSIPLLLLMGQQRDCIVYRDGSKRHLKLVGMLFDNCLDTLVQFGGFLSTHLNAEEYSRRIPMIDDLGLVYHIPVDISFFVTRPTIRNAISNKFSELEKALKSENEKLDKKSKTLQQEESYYTACNHVMDPIIESSRLLHSSKVWEDINHRLYSTFWSLSLYDLYVPTGRYEEEVNRAKQASRDVENNSDLTSSKKRKEQERNNVLIEKLQDEKQRQQDNHRLVTTWLKREKDSWFYPKVLKNRAITQFLQLCIFPRCRFTASDAIYCAKFVYMLHSLHTPNFSTLLFLDRSFSDISYTVTCCTENEARRYGRFMGVLLETVSRWHQSESTYTNECANTPGFISMMRTSGATNEKIYLDYENYRHITFKWHFKITKSLVTLLESQDYMQVRNGLIVLTKMLPYYPKVYHLSIVLEKRIESIMEEEKEKRPDLYALAIGYAGMLKNQRHNLIMENEFHIKEERVKAQQSSTQKSSTVSKTSDSSDSTQKSSTVSSKLKNVVKSDSSDSKGIGKEAKSSSGKPKPSSHEVKKDGLASSSSSENVSKKNGESVVKKNGDSAVKKNGDNAKEKTSVSGTTTPSSTASGGEKTGRRASPSAGGVLSPKSGQRRIPAESPDLLVDKDVKRRKLEDSASKTSKADGNGADTPVSSKDKTKLDRKRERSADKDLSDSKRRKDSPEVSREEKKAAKKEIANVTKKHQKKTLRNIT